MRRSTVSGASDSLHGRNHGWRTTQEDFGVGGISAGEVLDDVVLGNKANATVPDRGRVVENVKDLEPGSVGIHELLEIVSQEDILLVDIGVNEADGGLVQGIFESSTDDLDHGGDASTTGKHADVVRETGEIVEVALGALDTDGVTDFESGNVTGDVSLFI